MAATVSVSMGVQLRLPQYTGRSTPAVANAGPSVASSSRHWPLIGETPPKWW